MVIGSFPCSRTRRNHCAFSPTNDRALLPRCHCPFWFDTGLNRRLKAGRRIEPGRETSGRPSHKP